MRTCPISHTLQPDGLRPPPLPTAADLHLRDGLSVEEYFAMKSRLTTLAAKDTRPLGPGEGCGSGADGIPRRHELGPDSDLGVSSVLVQEKANWRYGRPDR